MIYLASQSPRRRELLHMLGLEFEVHPADIDEHMDPTRPPEEEVARVARAKALAVCKSAPEGTLVIAADTIVVCRGEILGKPRDEQDARRMLTLLSGSRHQVFTGLAVCRGEEEVVQTERTDLLFRPISAAEMDGYLATGESFDKAGAYAIQGRAALFCTRLEGDYYNVMGLPLCALGNVLSHFGLPILEGGAAG